MTQCCNTQKVKRIAITAFIVVVMAFVFCNLFTVQAHAAGLLDETIDATHEFSKYSINNYQLDFYVDTSWDWLPWNWKDGLGKTVQYAFYMFTNLIWTMNLYMSNAVGYLIQQAYDLDFISSAADTVGTNIQLITGISPSGFDTTGLFPGMIALITLMVGLYCIYAACVKHEITKALHAALNYAVVFIASFCLIAYAPSAIKGLNEFSSDISNGVINASAKILAPDATNTSTGVATIRDCLFGIQVKQPWLLMQFGDTDVETIGEERVNDLLGTSPKTNKGEDREEVVKSEIEDYDNGNLTITEVNNRLGLSFVFLIFNIIISIFAIALAGSMLLSQVLFLINAMFLPISLLISMIPAFSGTSKRAVVSLFNTIMLRVGTTLLTTFVLMLSSIVYSAVGGMAFILVLIMQLVVFAGVYMQKERLLGMIGLQPDGAGGRMGRAIAGRSRGVLSRTMRKALPFGVGFGIGRRSGRNHTAQTTQRSSSSGTSTASRESSGHEDTQSQQTEQTKPNLGRRVGETVGKIADTPSRVKDKAAETAQKVKDLPTNAEYAVRSNVESARESVRETMQKRRESRAAQLEARRTTTASRREEMSVRREQSGSNASATTTQSNPAPERATVEKPPRQSQPETHNAATGSQCSVQPPARIILSRGQIRIIPQTERKPQEHPTVADKPNNENKPPVDRTPNRPMAERPTVHDKPQPGLDKETFGGERKQRPEPIADRKPERSAERSVAVDKPQQRSSMPAGLDKETFGAEFKQRESSKARMSAVTERTTQTTTTETTKRKTKSAEKRGGCK